MKKVASFVFHGKTEAEDKKVSLYTDQSGRIIIDMEGFPELLREFTDPEAAVAALARVREMSMKDWGASEVDWGGYRGYSKYWPEDATSWQEELR